MPSTAMVLRLTGTSTSSPLHPDLENHVSTGTGADLEATIFGTMDGLVTNLALVAGVFAAGTSLSSGHASVVLTDVRIAGVSAMLAGALSMFVGAWVSSRARFELAHREHAREEKEVELVPETEKREVQEIFEKWGFPEPDARAAAERLAQDKNHWIDFMMHEELGFSDEDLERPPKRHGAIIGLGYFLGSLVPLIPFLLAPFLPMISSPLLAFEIGLALSVLCLATVGAFKERFGGQRPLWGAAQMVVIGLCAAAAVYIITNLVFLL